MIGVLYAGVCIGALGVLVTMGVVYAVWAYKNGWGP